LIFALTMKLEEVRANMGSRRTRSCSLVTVACWRNYIAKDCLKLQVRRSWFTMFSECRCLQDRLRGGHVSSVCDGIKCTQLNTVVCLLYASSPTLYDWNSFSRNLKLASAVNGTPTILSLPSRPGV
jgi:hypothetical protein